MAIIDRQLPYDYTIASRLTDVMVMENHVQNINHSAFRSMFEREKLSENNFNDWFRQLKLVLRVEKKMHVIEQPIPPAPAANVLAKWNAVYDPHNEVACLMLETRVERFDLIQTFHACKQEKGKSVSQYVLKMKEYVEQLERLGYVLQQDLSVGLILNGLTNDFAGFVRNYNMHNTGKTIGELHTLLTEYEKGLPKKAVTPQVMAIQGGRIQKANKKSQNAKGMDKGNGTRKDKSYIPKPKHPKPNPKEHLAKNDTCHHCKEGLRGSRKLKQGDLYLYVGNEVRAQVEAIGSFDLVLPNGFVICLDNCHYVPSITRVSRNNVLYFNAIPSNGIYEVDMSNPVPNVNSIYNVSNKRVKHNLDSTYLKSFPHRPKRANDVLGLIHTDVCGPLRHVSRQGASYFITFMDDCSRYGYIYLLKHKHEIFETFKVFKNEVENQLGKTIKALRSDRGGEYISQEFKDYLKACGIVQQLTPPYTPQHNRVSERRNRTLLDMVRSMMNLTTLPLSFLDYALEAAARILNMVPSKKVDKTPYELWFGKVPKLSYLKPKETMGYYFYFLLENKIVVARYAEFFKKNLLSQEVSGRAGDLEEIQDEDTLPSEITSEIPMEVEEVEEHSLGDLNEPANYKAAMLDPESNKWLDAMNAKMQSMKDNYVWRLADLPLNETFLPVADIRAIRILIAITAFYEYEIWKMDVKTAFLNGYLDEDIYMVQH
nr:hypothetical protein [Tanacetum cinerariifolium]